MPRLCAVTLPLILVPFAAASARADSGQLTVIPVATGIYMLMGKGGNIAVATGSDGVLLVDAQYADAHADIVAAVKKITPQPIKVLINTHWHGDHTGGNEQMGLGGATIVAHRNVRQLMLAPQTMPFFGRDIPAAPAAALPVVTYDDRLEVHMGTTVRVEYVPGAHTSGDSILYWPEQNVIHAGDTFFNGIYPFIDLEHGGGIDGMIAAGERVLALANNDTKIIPGHGRLASRDDLARTVDMWRTVRNRVAALLAQGKGLAAVIAAQPSAEFDAAHQGFLAPEQYVALVYTSLAGRQ